MTVKPFTPKEAQDKKDVSFPDEVIETFNEFLAERYANGYARIEQGEVLNLIVSKFATHGKVFSRQQILDRGWLDIESAYRKAGWTVRYDRPGFNETYEAFWEFTKRRDNSRDPAFEERG